MNGSPRRKQKVAVSMQQTDMNEVTRCTLDRVRGMWPVGGFGHLAKQLGERGLDRPFEKERENIPLHRLVGRVVNGTHPPLSVSAAAT